MSVERIEEIRQYFPHLVSSQIVSNASVEMVFVVDAPYRGLLFINIYCYEKLTTNRWLLRCIAPISILSCVSPEQYNKDLEAYDRSFAASNRGGLNGQPSDVDHYPLNIYVPQYHVRSNSVDVLFRGVKVLSVISIKDLDAKQKTVGPTNMTY